MAVKFALLFAVGLRPGGLRPARSAAARRRCWRWAANSPSWCSPRRCKAGLIDSAHARPAGGGGRPVDGADAAAADRGVAPGSRPHPEPKPKRAFDTIPDDHPQVLIAGFGRFGQIVARLLRGAAHSVHRASSTASSRSTSSRRFGSLIYYGDPARPNCCARPARRSVQGVRGRHRRRRDQPAHGAR